MAPTDIPQLTPQAQADLALVDKTCGAYLRGLASAGHEVAAQALQAQVIAALQRLAESLPKKKEGEP